MIAPARPVTCAYCPTPADSLVWWREKGETHKRPMCTVHSRRLAPSMRAVGVDVRLTDTDDRPLGWEVAS